MAGAQGPRSTVIVIAVVVALLAAVVAVWGVVFVDFARPSSSAETASAASSAAASKGSKDSTSTSTSDDTEPAEGEWTMDQAREAFAADDSRTLVLGDSTGNDRDEWIHMWGELEGLPVASWQMEFENGYTGESSETRIWSGSMDQATADYPLQHWDEMWPDPAPDVVLLSYGQFHDSGEDAVAALEELRAALAERAPEVPVVVVLQNPQADDANAATREAIAAWAQESGLPTIDVAAAFEESGLYPADLRLDQLHPSLAGSRLWAETVAAALAG